MSSKRRLGPFKLINAVSMGASIISKLANIQLTDNIGIQCDTTSTDAEGVLNIEVSADHVQDAEGNVLVDGHWTVLTTATISTGIPTPVYFDLNQLSAPWLRVRYARTSGTGTLTATLVGKML
jgi:hypothetical protein